MVAAAASTQPIKFVVLDRPNPVGGTIVDGPLMKPAFSSFVGRKVKVSCLFQVASLKYIIRNLLLEKVEVMSRRTIFENLTLACALLSVSHNYIKSLIKR